MTSIDEIQKQTKIKLLEFYTKQRQKLLKKKFNDKDSHKVLLELKKTTEENKNWIGKDDANEIIKIIERLNGAEPLIEMSRLDLFEHLKELIYAIITELVQDIEELDKRING